MSITLESETQSEIELLKETVDELKKSLENKSPVDLASIEQTQKFLKGWMLLMSVCLIAMTICLIITVANISSISSNFDTLSNSLNSLGDPFGLR